MEHSDDLGIGGRYESLDLLLIEVADATPSPASE